MKKLFAFIVVATLIGCASDNPTADNASNTPTSKNNIVVRAKSYVSNLTFAPQNAQFRNVKVVKNNVVCGEINGQTDTGAYLGFLPFYYQQDDGKVFSRIQPEGGVPLSQFNSTYNANCK